MKLIYLLPVLLLTSFQGFSQKKSMTATLEVKNLTKEKPTIADMQKGTFSFEYALNGKLIPAKFSSCTVIHLKSTGDILPPMVCMVGKRWSTPKEYLQSLKISEGDQILIEDIIVQHNGRKIKIEHFTLKF